MPVLVLIARAGCSDKVAGLDAEHLALLRFSGNTVESRTEMEGALCAGRAWSFNLYDLRPSAAASFPAQTTGKKDVRGSCDDWNLRPLWNYLAPYNYKTGVLEIGAGIVIGPSVVGWVELDDAIRVLATIGLAFLLFLAGLEIEFRQLKGRPVRLAGIGYVASFGIAIALAFALKGAGLVETPLFVAIVLTATSLGVVVPVLKDSGEISSAFGQLIVAAASRFCNTIQTLRAMI